MTSGAFLSYHFSIEQLNDITMTDSSKTENSSKSVGAIQSDQKQEQESDTPDRSSRRSRFAIATLWATGIAICMMTATILAMLSWQTPTDGGYFIIVCLYMLVAAATISDAALRLIPNRLTYTALILSLLLTMVIIPALEILEIHDALRWIGACSGDWGGVAFESLKGFGLCLAIGLISFAARGLGGGDVKLLLSFGLLAGWSLTISILINTLIVAAIIGVINLIVRGVLIYYIQTVFIKIYYMVISRDFKTPITFNRTESPFCLSLLIGMILLHFIDLHSIFMEWVTIN